MATSAGRDGGLPGSGGLGGTAAGKEDKVGGQVDLLAVPSGHARLGVGAPAPDAPCRSSSAQGLMGVGALDKQPPADPVPSREAQLQRGDVDKVRGRNDVRQAMPPPVCLRLLLRVSTSPADVSPLPVPFPRTCRRRPTSPSPPPSSRWRRSAGRWVGRDPGVGLLWSDVHLR